VRRPVVAGLVLAGGLAALACGGREPVFLDLVAASGAADHVRAYGFALLGPPSGEPFRGPGLLLDDSGGLRRAHSRRVSELLFTFRAPEPRALVLDLEPAPGSTAQSVRLRLNDTAVGELELGSGRRRHRIELPEAAQKAGANRLGLTFREAVPVEAAGRVAAILHAVAFGPASDSSLTDLADAGAPPPFSIEAAPAGPRLVQAGAGAIRWAFRLPRDAELRVTPSLAPGARGRVRFRVVLQTEAAGPRELWAREVGTDAREVRLPLPGEPGTPAALSLEIEGGAGARGRWQTPRVVSPQPPDPPLRRGFAADEAQRAEALARELSGSSVLLIVLDAARARQFGAYGYSRPTTPEIDRIAREGVVLERAYAPAVYTLASMASLWTSLHPDEHGAGVEQGVKLGRGPLTLAERLEARGIVTGGFVANGMAGPAFGLDRGFSRFVEVFRGHGAAADSFRHEFWPWLSERRGGRFFAYAHYREPHFPYDAPASYVARFGPDAPLPPEARTQESFITRVNWGGRELSPEEQAHLVRLYDANLAYADSEIGALRRHLEALGLWDRLLVIVTADHGEALYEHDGFVGHNQQLYEPSVHIPLILRFPGGRGPAGSRVAGLVDTLDIAPTVADAFGLPAEARRGMAGRSLLPVILGAPGKDAVLSRSTGERPRFMLRDARFKYVYHSRFGPEELFDLETDPAEGRDLSASRPLLTACYRQRLAGFLLGLRRGQGEVVPEGDLTPEQRENLRALGYVQ
jgi:arylsulfatase